jgi:HEPN domain-containing protein
MDKLETTLEIDDTVVRIAKVIDSLYMIGRKSNYVHQATFERYQRELANIANEIAKLSRELGEEVRAEELARYEQSVIDSKYLEDDMSGARLERLLLQFGGE